MTKSRSAELTGRQRRLQAIRLFLLVTSCSACSVLADGWAIDHKLQVGRVDGRYDQSVLPTDAFAPVSNPELVLELQHHDRQYDVVEFQSVAGGKLSDCRFVIWKSGPDSDTSGECTAPDPGRRVTTSDAWVLVEDDQDFDAVKVKFDKGVTAATLTGNVTLVPLNCRPGQSVEVQFADGDEWVEPCPGDDS